MQSEVPSRAPAREPVPIAHGSRGRVIAPAAGRIAAAGVVICAAVHVPVLLMHHNASVALTVMMVIASVACLTCVSHLVRGPTLRTWASCGLFSGAMLVLHLALVLTTFAAADSGAPSGNSAYGAHHGADLDALPVGYAEHLSAFDAGLFWAATALALGQALLAATVVRRAGRSVEPSASSRDRSPHRSSHTHSHPSHPEECRR
jgi:hypothetical protein